jgi:hypothetical protein
MQARKIEIILSAFGTYQSELVWSVTFEMLGSTQQRTTFEVHFLEHMRNDEFNFNLL